MKTLISIVVIALIAFGAWFFLKDSPQSVTPAPQGEEVTLNDGSYSIDTTSSTLAWRGSRPLIPGYFDNGTVNIRSGNLQVADGAITGGSFTVDMTSIVAVSTGRGDGQDRLSGHLKSDDFFDVANHPTATFVITSVTPAGQVSGNLTVKGVTNPITFPAVISEEGETLRAQATVELDRTLWNIRYGSGKFFQDLGDNLISDTFTVTLNLVARKAN